MTKFSPSDAALEGFRLTREQPGSIVVWSLFYLIGILVMSVVMMQSAGPDFIKFIKHGGLESGDVTAYSAMLQKSWPAFVIILLIAIFVNSVLTGGIYRMVLRPTEPGFAHLQIGADELRLTAVNIVLFSIGMLSMVVLAGFAAAIGGVLGVLTGLVLLCVMIWIGVRLLLATPMTFGERRISILQSWRLTHGHFWSLLGMTLVSIIFYFMVWALFSIIGLAFVELAGGKGALADPTHLGPVAFIAFFVTLAVQTLLPTLQVVMVYSPLAVAYRNLQSETAKAAPL